MTYPEIVDWLKQHGWQVQEYHSPRTGDQYQDAIAWKPESYQIDGTRLLIYKSALVGSPAFISAEMKLRRIHERDNVDDTMEILTWNVHTPEHTVDDLPKNLENLEIKMALIRSVIPHDNSSSRPAPNP